MFTNTTFCNLYFIFIFISNYYNCEILIYHKIKTVNFLLSSFVLPTSLYNTFSWDKNTTLITILVIDVLVKLK